MGREVRRVPADWVHPKNEHGKYAPLYEGRRYTKAAAEFLSMVNKQGLQEAIDYCGQAPDKNDYMPSWSPEEATHYMMYEDTSKGTPISPAFATPEELAQWLADTNASAFGNTGASYDGWLRVARGGYAPSMVISNGSMQSGVDALTD